MIGEYEIAFSLIRGMGVELASKILDVIATEKDFFTLSESELYKIIGKKNKILTRNYRDEILNKARREQEFIDKNNIQLLYFKNEDYPQRLLDVSDAPILLFQKGETNINEKYIISVVGTRNATQYGKNITEDIIKEIAIKSPNSIIVSGLAYGIDVVAHKGALNNSLSTIGVLAHGLNMIYPAQHRNVAIDIIKNGGALITEYTSQDNINRGNFLARNRIVAALSDCTIVIESAEKGGALVTSAIANSYNRDVFAVPGRINDTYSKGCNNLIKQNKAVSISCADDIFKYMRWESTLPKKQELQLFPEYSTQEKSVIDFLALSGETHINLISNHLDSPIHKTMSLLVDMEFNGYVKSIPGGKYSL